MATLAKIDGTDSHTFGFLLLPEFPLYALVPAIEALRIANQSRGRALYEWRLVSVDGNPVSAGNGMHLSVDAGIADIPWHPMVFVFAGNHPLHHIDKRILNWLRRLGRHGATLGAVDTGAYALALAGQLTHYRATLHWEAIPEFSSRFPEVETCEQLFVIDRDRITCAGGHATLDLVLQLIRLQFGFELAQIVGNGFVTHRLRREQETQRMEAELPTSTDSSPFARILREMERHISSPLKAEELSERAGLSVREMGRVVRQRSGEAPMRYYRRVRLQAARHALFYGDLPIQDIARACGFTSPEIFSRSFRAHFGVCPSEFRTMYSRERLRQFRPELGQVLNLALSQENSDGTV
jgi:AraC family carnitine catabolism transcriptional activator